MIDPKTNRIDFGQQLIPPEGYEFDYAVGTSYSLDLESLLIIPVALFHSQLLDVDHTDIRFDMLDAITKASDKIVVYCQKGKIKVPDKYHFLLAYWEKGIEEIVMEHKAQSFHPKVWVLRYINKVENSIKYRILITSRNLAHSRDWDIAFCSEGEVGIEKIQSNKPLTDFLSYLSKKGKRKIPTEFINDLKKVSFDVPEEFSRLEFHPIGCNKSYTNEKYSNPVYKGKWKDLLVLSPFVQDATVDKLKRNTAGKFWLFSRKEELDTLDTMNLPKDNSYQFSRLIQTAEHDEAFSESDTQPAMQNFHAKLFIGTKHNSAYWYLGSANATDPANDRNIEFMIELKQDNGLKSPREIVKLLTNDKEKVVYFEKYNSDMRENQSDRKKIEILIRDIVFSLTKILVSGEAVQTQETRLYDLIILFNAKTLKLPSDFEVRIKPLPVIDKQSEVIKPGHENIIKKYTGFTETQLSSFIVWEVYYKGELQKQFLSQMEIDFPDSRLSKIFSSIIDSTDKFYKYIAFLLNGEESDFVENTKIKSDAAKYGVNAWKCEIPGMPLFEKLLIAASRHPQKLKSINDLINKLKAEDSENTNKLLSQEFEQFWGAFTSFMEEK